MIDAKEAVRIANEYFSSMYEGGPLAEILLEEVELSEEGDAWLVTIGFDWQPTSGTASLGPGERKYKLMRLEVETGRLVSMKRIGRDS